MVQNLYLSNKNCQFVIINKQEEHNLITCLNKNLTTYDIWLFKEKRFCKSALQ